MDHKKLRFSKPVFATYDCGYHHIICSDYEPATWDLTGQREWKGFNYFWKRYVYQWLENSDTGCMHFVINGDESVYYQVKMLDFVYNTMFDEQGRLKVVSKQYQKRDRKSVSGYRTIKEPVTEPIEI